MDEASVYDLIIIGAGPAGLTASIYASCFHLKHLVIGAVLGGQMMNAPDILNYPGFEEISGKELTERMINQVKKRGGEMVMQSVTKISKIKDQISKTQIKNQNLNNNQATKQPSHQVSEQSEENKDLIAQSLNSLIADHFEIETQSGLKYQTKSIILATGTERRKLNVPGEREYLGRGVYYCATCGRQDYERKICAVAGGANSAIQAAVTLSQAATKVYIIYRGEELRGDPVWLEQTKNNPKIEVIYKTVVTEVVGDGEKLTGVRINTNNPTIEQSSNGAIELDKLFIEIGGVPGTALLIPLGIEMDQGEYVRVNEKLETTIPGVFAAGDLVSYGLSIEQISSAVGLGARAAASAFAFLKKDKAPTFWGMSQIKR
jgi:thioredoxin reductase (NADPH)